MPVTPDGGILVQFGASFQKLRAQVNTGFAQLKTQLGGNTKAIGKSLSGIGKDLSQKITAPIGVMGAAIVAVAGSFEASMNTVQALTGATGAQGPQGHKCS